MNLQNNTILITGGSSGIGLELTKQLLEFNNKIIICGRSNERLKATKEKFPEIDTFQCDLSIENEVLKLIDYIKLNHHSCNIIINNAAIVHKTNFFNDHEMITKAKKEFQTNLLAPIVLAKELYPLIILNNFPAIINVTSGLAFVPRVIYPIYNATKAALHSITQVMRKQNENADLQIIEVMFPAVDTPWHKGSPPKIAIPVDKAVNEMIDGLKKNKLEIKIGAVKKLYFFSRLLPSFIFKKLNAME